MWLIALLLVHPQFVDCGCFCVEGVPKTLCQSIEEAQAGPAFCRPERRCPVPQSDGAAAPDQPRYLDAPSEQARNCREVRVWHSERAQFTGVYICDVLPV